MISAPFLAHLYLLSIFSFSYSTYHLLTHYIIYQFSDLLTLSPIRMHSLSGQSMVFSSCWVFHLLSFLLVACPSPLQVLGDSWITPWRAVGGRVFQSMSPSFLFLCPGHLVASPWGQQMWFPCLSDGVMGRLTITLLVIGWDESFTLYIPVLLPMSILSVDTCWLLGIWLDGHLLGIEWFLRKLHQWLLLRYQWQ